MPETVREKVEKLRARGGNQARLAEILLGKRATATTETQRAAIDEQLLKIGRVSTSTWIVVGVIQAVLVILAVYFLSGKNHAASVRTGVSTLAQVKRLDEGFCVFGTEKSECLELTLELHPTNGAPYQAKLTHDIGLEWMSRVQPGSWLTVAVDRADAQKLYFDEDALRVEAPKPPVK